MSLVGSKVRQYRILSRLGEGGMGDVYEALDETLQRNVALKAIKPGRGLDPVTRDRFLREARILSQLDHPGICRIYDYIQVKGEDYLVLELIQGTTLTEARDTLDRVAKLRIARQITRVLAVAHAADVIHRDLKPDNVMITETGEVKVLDFGLARSGGPEAEGTAAPRVRGADDPGATLDLSPGPELSDGTIDLGSNANTTMPGAVVGTPAFMSPEQARGDDVGPATDMYSLGLTLHWLLEGGHGYHQTRDVLKLMDDVKAGRTVPLDGAGHDPHLVHLVERLKSSTRASRPTASETLERLDWIIDKPRRRNRRLATAALMVALLGFGLKYTLDVRSQRQVAERHRAEAEGLIEFMVGDLREKLEPVGRLDVLDEVGAKALEYYESREEDDLSDPDRFRLVRTLTQVGEVRLGEGDLQAAEAAFDRALASAEQLHRHDPRNTEWLAALSATHFWLGNVRYSEDDLEGADREFRTYYAHSQRLRAIEPDNPAWRLEIAYATTNLAALSEARRDIPAALAYLDSSISIKKELVAEFPDDQEKKESLANSLAWAGRSLGEQGEFEPALARLLEAEALIAELSAAAPRDMTLLSLLATGHHLVGNVFENLGHDGEARARYEADLSISRKLVLHDPANMTWKREGAASLRSLGRFHVRAGEPALARPYLEETSRIDRELLALTDLDAETEADLLVTWLARCELLATEGRPAACLAETEALIEDFETRLLADPLVLKESYLAAAWVLRGEVARSLGRTELQDEAEARAEEILAPLIPGSRDVGALVTWLRLQVLTGNRSEATEVTATLDEMGFARRDVVNLRRLQGL